MGGKKKEEMARIVEEKARGKANKQQEKSRTMSTRGSAKRKSMDQTMASA